MLAVSCLFFIFLDLIAKIQFRVRLSFQCDSCDAIRIFEDVIATRGAIARVFGRTRRFSSDSCDLIVHHVVTSIDINGVSRARIFRFQGATASFFKLFWPSSDLRRLFFLAFTSTLPVQ